MLGTNADEGTIFAPAMLLIVPNVTLPFSNTDIVKIIAHCLVRAPSLVEFVGHRVLCFPPALACSKPSTNQSSAY